jgi:hypothetical protein
MYLLLISRVGKLNFHFADKITCLLSLPREIHEPSFVIASRCKQRGNPEKFSLFTALMKRIIAFYHSCAFSKPNQT